MPRKTPVYWLFMKVGQHYSEEPLPIFEKVKAEDDNLLRLFLFIYIQKLLQSECEIEAPIVARLMDFKTGEIEEKFYSLKEVKQSVYGLETVILNADT